MKLSKAFSIGVASAATGAIFAIAPIAFAQTIMPDPMHGYTNLTAGGDTNYSGGPTETTNVSGYANYQQGGSVMPDPTHGYGKTGMYQSGDATYSGGPSDTMVVDGSVQGGGTVMPDPMHGYTTLTAGGDTNYSGGPTDAMTVWSATVGAGGIWCPPNPLMGIPCVIQGQGDANGTVMPDPTHGYGKNGMYQSGDANYSGGPNGGSTVVSGSSEVNGTIMPDPMHGYTNLTAGGDTNYSGGPTETTNVSGSINPPPPAQQGFLGFFGRLGAYFGF